MSTTGVIPGEQSLATAFAPDREYVDGMAIERNAGELEHSELQGELVAWFRARRRRLGKFASPELRVRLDPRRFRLPDLCLVCPNTPATPILTEAPLAVIEIPSSDDRMAPVEDKLEDYLRRGVGHVWLIDPLSRRVWAYTRSGRRELAGGFLRIEDPRIELPLSEIFAALDSD